MGKDKNKDQSYFLALLSQEQLAKSIFPLGNLEKSEVRKIAEKNNLITAEKKDSQGICFLGEKINLKDFLKEYIPEKKGRVLNTLGQEIGEHDGAVFYTIGERHGFEIFPEAKTPNMPRLFVIKKDVKNNILIVGSAEDLKKINAQKEKKEIRFSRAN
jgi:tRNA-specific 2-thiouridylase